MAVVTSITDTGNMEPGFTAGPATVMATETGSRCNIGVIERRGTPAGGSMTLLTIIAAFNMSRRLADGLPAVMTVATAPGNNIVVHPYQRRPLQGGMALFAHRHRVDVIY